MNDDLRQAHQGAVVPSMSSLPASEKSDTFRLHIVYRKIDTLRPNPRNTRTHSKSQIRKIKRSIKEFGFVDPPSINSSDEIITGHASWAAAKELGLDEIPTICLDHLTPAQIRAFMIAHNRLALDAGWDKGMLRVELTELSTIYNVDIEVTGFTLPEVDVIMLDSISSDEERLLDRIPPLSPTAVTQPGDLWLMRDHRILCSDSRDPLTYTTLLAGRKAAAAFLDPPYNVAIHGHASGNGKTHHREFAMGVGEMTDEDFTDFLHRCLRLAAKHSINGAVHFVAMDWRHGYELTDAGRSAYSKLLNICVWVKNNGGMGSLYRSQHEFIYVWKVGTAPHRNNVELGRHGRNRTNVWNYPGANSLSRVGTDGNLVEMHPTAKPINLVADAILDCTAPGDIVLDTFCGSGTTLLAAERLRRACYAVETDPAYVDLAVRRWQQLTGEHAVHSTTGQRFNDVSDQEVLHEQR